MKKILYLLTVLISFSINAQQIEEKNHFETSSSTPSKSYYLQSFKDPLTGEANYNNIQEAHQFIYEKYFKPSKNGRIDAAFPYIEWEHRGPNNFAGRIERVMVDPNVTSTAKVWAGSNTGGLYYNNDYKNPNSNWIEIDRLTGPNGIYDITYNQSNTQHYYCSAWGGIYRSTNAGVDWSLIPNAPAANELLIVSNSEMYSASFTQGVMKSIDGGNTWIPILKPSTSIGISGLGSTFTNVFHAIKKATDGTLFAISQTGVVFKSTNGGVNWTMIWSRTTNNSIVSHLEIARSTSGANQVIYILVGDGLGAATDGLFKSIDGGITWTQKRMVNLSNPIRLAPGWWQYTLNSVLKIHPNDPNTIFVGTLGLWRSTDSGDNWDSFANQSGASSPAGNADYHDIDFFSNNNEILIGHDQGAFIVNDINTAVVVVNSAGPPPAIYRYWNSSASYNYKLLSSTQVHWGALRQIANDNVFCAATQDQNSLQLSGTGVGSATKLANNEGCWAKFDDDQPNILLYTSMGSVHLYVKDLNTNSSLNITAGSASLPSLPNWSTYFGGGNNASRDYNSLTNTAYAAHIVDSSVPGRVWFRKVSNINPVASAGRNVVTDFYIDGIFAKNGTTSIYGDDLLQRPIRIRLGKTPGVMFVSGYSGGIGSAAGGVLYKVTNIDDPNPTNRIATRININGAPNSDWALMPNHIAVGANDNQILVTIWANGAVPTIFYTNNGGVNWQDLKKISGTTTLTGFPRTLGAFAGEFNPLNYNQMILTTDAGVWTCDDISLAIPQWQLTNAKFANVPLRNIEIRPSDGTVMVATYGR
ncbi:MAG: WD40/YVTN/BNR-like repeat-containing protein, partial [Emticicia sp.]|uniref:WD40/YVTN/BNR-like repeat-containing protein n=1 Tax=Emticicia sp. TaxID=1930953 RepID=UPI003BA5E12B